MGFLEGKTVIVTGGGRAVLEDGTCGSIGYGIVTAFAKEGANIVITGRNLKKLEDAKEEIERLYNVEVLPVQADVNAGADNEAVVNSVVEKAIEKFEKAYPEAFKANVHTPPMGHFGDNEKEIGRVVVQLTSPDFKYMTGETITLEGGLGMRP